MRELQSCSKPLEWVISKVCSPKATTKQVLTTHSREKKCFLQLYLTGMTSPFYAEWFKFFKISIQL